jgi:hypothetical protein
MTYSASLIPCSPRVMVYTRDASYSQPGAVAALPTPPHRYIGLSPRQKQFLLKIEKPAGCRARHLARETPIFFGRNGTNL